MAASKHKKDISAAMKRARRYRADGGPLMAPRLRLTTEEREGLHGRHGLEATVPLGRNSDFFVSGSVAPRDRYKPHDLPEARFGFRRRFADGGEVALEENPALGISNAAIGLGKKAVDHYRNLLSDPWAKKDDGSYVADDPSHMTPNAAGKIPEIRKDPMAPVYGAADLASNVAPVGKAIMVGPLGAMMVRNTQKMHPAVRASLPPAQDAMLKGIKDVDYRESVGRGLQSLRDEEARGILEMRKAAGNPDDKDLWHRSGWWRGEEGGIKKELPDTGFELVPKTKEGGYKYIFKHPSGDALNKAYEMPLVTFDPKARAGEGFYDPKSNSITVGGRPWIESEFKKGKTAALHEVQHLIDKKEGFAHGSSTMIEGVLPDAYTKHFGVDWTPQRAKDAMLAATVGHADPRLFKSYKESAGEVGARNTTDRRAKSYKYLSHPRDTMDTPPGLQNVRPFPRNGEDVRDWARRMIRDKGFDPEDFAKRQKGGAVRTKPMMPRFARGGDVDDKDLYEPALSASQPMDPSGAVDTTGSMNWRDLMDLYDAGRWRERETEFDDLENPAQPMAGGGNPYAPKPKASDISGYMSRKMIHKAANPGMLKSPVPGRTDKLPISVPSGSYVIPADIVSGLGQGNSDAGNAVLSKMFTAGPMGMEPMKARGRAGKSAGASRIGTAKLTKGSKISSTSTFAQGGAAEPVDVIAAGGEYILHPEQVASLGGGNVDRGHEILDAFVLKSRKELVKTLKRLPGPVKGGN